MILDDDFAWSAYDEDQKWSIWSWLKEHRDDWDRLVRDYWGVGATACPSHLEPKSWENARRLAVLADGLLVSGRTLSLESSPERRSPARLTEGQLKKLQSAFRNLRGNPIVRDLIGLALADEVLRQASGAEGRLFRLLSVVRQAAVSDRAATFLKRATTLYLFGFEPEVAIMARGALEAALRERIGPKPLRGAPDLSLEELMEKAGETDVLPTLVRDKSPRGWYAKSRSELWHADRIRLAGNFALHDKPGFRPPDDGIHDAYSVIRELTIVLRAVFP